jgi:hypothetical protein
MSSSKIIEMSGGIVAGGIVAGGIVAGGIVAGGIVAGGIDDGFMGSHACTIVSIVGLNDKGASNACAMATELTTRGNTVFIQGLDDNAFRLLIGCHVSKEDKYTRTPTMKDFDIHLENAAPVGAYRCLLTASAELRESMGHKRMGALHPFRVPQNERLFFGCTGDPTNALGDFITRATPISNRVSTTVDCVGWVWHAIVGAAKACNANYVVLDLSGPYESLRRLFTTHSDIFFISCQDTIQCRSAMERYSIVFAESYTSYYGDEPGGFVGWREQSRGYKLLSAPISGVRYPLPDKKPLLAGIILHGSHECLSQVQRYRANCLGLGADNHTYYPYTSCTMQAAQNLTGIFERAGFGYSLSTSGLASYNHDTPYYAFYLESYGKPWDPAINDKGLSIEDQFEGKYTYKDWVDKITSFSSEHACKMHFNIPRSFADDGPEYCTENRDVSGPFHIRAYDYDWSSDDDSKSASMLQGSCVASDASLAKVRRECGALHGEIERPEPSLKKARSLKSPSYIR